MKPRWMRRSAVAVLFLSLSLWSCDSAHTPTGAVPEPASGPAFSTTSSSYYQIPGDDGSVGLATALIGAEGGTITLGEHRLTVPAGAVSAPTAFTVQIVDEKYITVLLTAIQGTLDIGEQGFAKPVQLTLSYSTATEPVDESRLLVLWIKDDGTFEAQPTTVDTAAKRVRADLGHFSGYTIGGDKEEGATTP